MRERRKRVVAHVLASGLLRVAHEFTLFIVVDGFAADGCQHDAEDDEHSQPYLPHEGGVIGDLIQQTSQEAPTHGAKVTGELNELWMEKRNETDTSILVFPLFLIQGPTAALQTHGPLHSFPLFCLFLRLQLYREEKQNKKLLLLPQTDNQKRKLQSSIYFYIRQPTFAIKATISKKKQRFTYLLVLSDSCDIKLKVSWTM